MFYFLLFICLILKNKLNLYLVLKHLLNLFFFFILLSCYKKTDVDSVVYARVGDSVLTKDNINRFGPKEGVVLDHAPAFIRTWVNNMVLLISAKKAGLDKDKALKMRRDEYYEQLLRMRFIETRAGETINISNEKIKQYYIKNRDSFKFLKDEVSVTQYVTKEKSNASLIYRQLQSKAREVTLDTLLYDLNIGTIQKGTFPKKIDDILFSGTEKVKEPVAHDGLYFVFFIQNQNKKGSQKGLELVYDEIYQRLFKEASVLKNVVILDSLKKTFNIYINPKFINK